MARRSTSKPLYELMVTDRGRPPRAASPPVEPSSDEDVEPGSVAAGRLVTTLSAGRSVRLPIGYLVLAVPCLIIAIVLAYMFGAWRGADRVQQDADRFIADLVGDDPAWKASDPLATSSGPDGEPPGSAAQTRGGDDGESGAAAGSGAGPGAERQPLDRTSAPPAGGGTPPVGDGAVPDADRWDAIEKDPREAGLHYLVLAETRREGARRLAEFLRVRGLEAYIVPSDNPLLRRVVVLPGFDTSDKTDPDVARLIEAVHRVGRAWKAEYPFESDLSDAYLLSY